MYSTDKQSANSTLNAKAVYDPVVPASKLNAILDRVRQSVAMADGARSNFGAELDRLLGCIPTAAGNKPFEPGLNSGVVGDLDDAISDLITTLEHITGQSHRLASV